MCAHEWSLKSAPSGDGPEDCVQTGIRLSPLSVDLSVHSYFNAFLSKIENKRKEKNEND